MSRDTSVGHTTVRECLPASSPLAHVDAALEITFGRAEGGTEVLLNLSLGFRGALRALALVPGFLRGLALRPIRRELDRLPEAFDCWRTGRPFRRPFETTSAFPATAVPVRVESPTAIGTDPADWMGWDAETLAENEAGRITSAQRRRLLRSLVVSFLALLLVAPPICAALGLWLGLSLRSQIAGGLIGALVFAPSAALRLRALNAVWADVRGGTCASVEGVVRVAQSDRGRSEVASLDGMSWRRSRPTGFVSGADYRVFYLPRSRRFVNAEPRPVATTPFVSNATPVQVTWALRSVSGMLRGSGSWKGVI